jgi:cell division septal protein FtsQ
MAKKDFLKKNNQSKHAQFRKINFFKIFYWFFALAFIGVVAYVLFFSGFLNILTVEFSPTKKIETQLLKSKLDAFLREKYFRLVPKNNLLLLGEGRLNDVFAQTFKIVKKIKITKRFPDKIKIAVEERDPILVLENSQGKFILDRDGNAYPYDYFDSSEFNQAELPILKEENSERAFSFADNSGADYLDFILGIKEKLEKMLDIPLEKTMTVPKIISEDVIFKTQEGWQIYFNKNVAIGKEIEMLRIVLEEKIEKAKRPDLEYIDLRTDNKISYKFKDAQTEKTAEKKSEGEDKKKK